MKELAKNKKGQVFGQLSDLVIGLVTVGIVLVVVFLIFSETKANTTVAADANATQALVEMQNATDDVPGWMSIIVVVVIGALLIGLISFFRRRG